MSDDAHAGSLAAIHELGLRSRIAASRAFVRAWSTSSEPCCETRAMLAAALSGELDDVEYRTDDLFGFEVPVAIPGVVSKLLDPRSTWRDPSEYDERARELAQMFRDNFAKFADEAGEAVAAAGPRL